MNQTNQTNQLSLNALNAAHAISFCQYWGMAAAALNMLLPVVPNPTLKSAIQALIAAGSSVCNSSVSDEVKGSACPCPGGIGDSALSARRHQAEMIINKAALDPQWRTQLLNDPRSTLAAAGFDVTPLPDSESKGKDWCVAIST